MLLGSAKKLCAAWRIWWKCWIAVGILHVTCHRYLVEEGVMGKRDWEAHEMDSVSTPSHWIRCCNLRKMHGLIKKTNTSLLGFTFLFSVRKGSSSWDCNLIMATTVCSKHRRKRFSIAIPQQKAYSAWNQMFLFSLSSLSIMDIPSFYTCDGDDGAYYSRSRVGRVTLNICCSYALYTVAVGTSAVTMAIVPYSTPHFVVWWS